MSVQNPVAPDADTPMYETRAAHHPDGIGKWYMGHWMQERDAALRERRDLTTVRPIEDGSMILKLMLGDGTTTAADYPDVNKLPKSTTALMVKDAQGSKDGWVWGTWSLTTPEKQQIDWPPPANFPFQWMEAGNYCVNCHASATASWGSGSSASTNWARRASAAARRGPSA